MSVKGGNLGARVWSSQLLIDNQAARTGIPTRPAHLPARGQVPCTWRGTAVINDVDDLADQARGDERGTCDIRQFAATAGEPGQLYEVLAGQKRSGACPDGPASFALFLQQDSLGIQRFRYTESCWWSCQLIPGNLLGGHLGAVLWPTTPPPAPSLLQKDTMPSTTISIPPWQHGYGRGGSCCCLLRRPGRAPVSSSLEPCLLQCEVQLSMPTNSQGSLGGSCAHLVLITIPRRPSYTEHRPDDT